MEPSRSTEGAFNHRETSSDCQAPLDRRYISMRTVRGTISRVVWVEAIGVVLVLLGLYGGTISANLSIAHDSIHYINTIDDGRNLYHPHHLLYAPVARLWVLACRELGFQSVDSAALVSMLNVVFGALTCGVVFVFCRARLNLERFRAVVGTGLAACSFGMWYYSVCVEVYVIPAFWLLVTLLIMTRARLGMGSCVAMGVTCGLAALFHQTHVLFGLPGVVGLATVSEKPARWRLLAIGAFIATGMIVTCVPYAIVLRTFVVAESWPQAWRWLTEYAQGSQWGTLETATIPKAVIGFGRSLVGGHFLFASPFLASVVDRFLGEHHLMDERFLIRHMPVWQAWGFLATGLTACVLTILAVERGLLGCFCWPQDAAGRADASVRSPTCLPATSSRESMAPTCATQPHGGISPRRFLAILVSWFVVYALFFAWWEPENLEFWIAPSLAFWMSVLTILRRTRHGWHMLGGAMVLLLATNLFGSILHLRSRDNDYYYHRTQPLVEAARAGDAIIVARRWIWGDYLQRYAPAEVCCMTDNARAGNGSGRVVRAIESALAGGHRVFVTADAEEPILKIRCEAGDPFSDSTQPWWQCSSHWRRVESQGSVFYVIERESGKRTGKIEDHPSFNRLVK